jgi:hypothetical protein
MTHELMHHFQDLDEADFTRDLHGNGEGAFSQLCGNAYQPTQSQRELAQKFYEKV